MVITSDMVIAGFLPASALFALYKISFTFFKIYFAKLIYVVKCFYGIHHFLLLDFFNSPKSLVRWVLFSTFNYRIRVTIIIDDVALGGNNYIERWRETLKGFPVLWIGLTAPIAILEERKRLRGDRAIGSSRVQLELVHHGNIKYDYFFDTAELPLDQMVQQVVFQQAQSE